MIDFDPVREFFFIFTIAIVRLTAACAVVPFMSTQVIPGRLRNSLLFSWGIIIFPMVQPTLSIDTSNMVVLLSIVIKEVVIGILLGFLSSKIFWLAMSVGFFIDNQRGASMASVMDPTSGEQTSPIGQFLQQSILTLFYTAGGFLVFLGGMFESYAIWPIDSFFPQFSPEFPKLFLEFVDDLMLSTIVLVSPIAITVFVAEFGLGLMNRFAPQLNVFVLAMPVKSMIAMIVLIIYLPFLMMNFQDRFIGGKEMFDFLQNVIS